MAYTRRVMLLTIALTAGVHYWIGLRGLWLVGLTVLLYFPLSIPMLMLAKQLVPPTLLLDDYKNQLADSNEPPAS